MNEKPSAPCHDRPIAFSEASSPPKIGPALPRECLYEMPFWTSTESELRLNAFQKLLECISYSRDGGGKATNRNAGSGTSNEPLAVAFCHGLLEPRSRDEYHSPGTGRNCEKGRTSNLRSRRRKRTDSAADPWVISTFLAALRPLQRFYSRYFRRRC